MRTLYLLQISQLLTLVGLLVCSIAPVLSEVIPDTAPRDSLASRLFDITSPHYNGNTAFKRRWHGPPPAPADDATWERFRCKGRRLLYQMSLSDRDVASLLDPPRTTVQSPYNFNTLETWGWEIGKSTASYRDLKNGGTWGVAGFFEAIGVSNKFVEQGGDWEGLRISHYHMTDSPWSQTEPQEQLGYQDPTGRWRRQTGAFNVIAVNPHGHMMVQSTRGPRASADKWYGSGRFPDNELPDMKALSDILWVAWQHVADKTFMDTFMSLTITNEVTNSLIARAMNNAGVPLSVQPHRFWLPSDEALALLASPNGAAFAHFLIQRKGEVGHKTIQSIWAFECESASRSPCLMFGIKNVDHPAQLPTEGDQATPLQKRNIVHEHRFHVETNATMRKTV